MERFRYGKHGHLNIVQFGPRARVDSLPVSREALNIVQGTAHFTVQNGSFV
jgi:hypothetical protein